MFGTNTYATKGTKQAKKNIYLLVLRIGFEYQDRSSLYHSYWLIRSHQIRWLEYDQYNHTSHHLNMSDLLFATGFWANYLRKHVHTSERKIFLFYILRYQEISISCQWHSNLWATEVPISAKYMNINNFTLVQCLHVPWLKMIDHPFSWLIIDHQKTWSWTDWSFSRIFIIISYLCQWWPSSWMRNWKIRHRWVNGCFKNFAVTV